MRLFSSLLRPNSGYTISQGNWSRPDELSSSDISYVKSNVYNEQDLRKNSYVFRNKTLTGVYPSFNGFTYGTISTINATDVGDFIPYFDENDSDGKYFALINKKTVSDIVGYSGYSVSSSGGTSWTNKTFSTSGNWANCTITNVAYCKNFILLLGFKLVNNERVGIFSVYYNNGSSWVLTNPKQLDTNRLIDAVYINDKNYGKIVIVGENGYIASTNLDSTEFQPNNLLNLEWDIQQPNENVQWKKIVTNILTNITVAISSDGYITVCEYGKSWTTPEKISSLDTIYDICCVYGNSNNTLGRAKINSFYLIGLKNSNNCICSTRNGIRFSDAKVIDRQNVNVVFRYITYSRECFLVVSSNGRASCRYLSYN
jgi:hypothetical protein